MIEAFVKPLPVPPAGRRYWDAPGGWGFSPSLVDSTHNSAFCTEGRWFRGQCEEHGTQRFFYGRCKRRTCPVCGLLGRKAIAERIVVGVEGLWPCAWMVLTFRKNVLKRQATQRLANFIRVLRERLPDLQYVATYEVTKAGRLHVNLIVGRWVYFHQRELSRLWGARLWVAWVRDEGKMSREATKAYSVRSLGAYVAKLEQVVKEGRRVSYSKGWPKLSAGKEPPKFRSIKWSRLDLAEENRVKQEIRLGWLVEKEARLFGYPWDEPCTCFQDEALKKDFPVPRKGGGLTSTKKRSTVLV